MIFLVYLIPGIFTELGARASANTRQLPARCLTRAAVTNNAAAALAMPVSVPFAAGTQKVRRGRSGWPSPSRWA